MLSLTVCWQQRANTAETRLQYVCTDKVQHLLIPHTDKFFIEFTYVWLSVFILTLCMCVFAPEWFYTLNLKQRAVWSSWNPLIRRPSIIYNIFPLINLLNYALHWFQKMLTIIKRWHNVCIQTKTKGSKHFQFRCISNSWWYTYANHSVSSCHLPIIIINVTKCAILTLLYDNLRDSHLFTQKNACQGLNHLLGSGREKSPTEKWGEWVWYGK